VSPDARIAVRLPDGIVSWIEAVTGGRLVGADRRPGGARKEAWFVDVRRPGGDIDGLFLRLDRADPSPGDPWSVRREAVVYRALQDSEVPLPRLLAVHPDREAMLSERVTGDNWFSRISDPGLQLRTARDFMAKLAALHRIDPAHLDLPGFPKSATVVDLIRHELDELEQVLAVRGGEPDPFLRFTLAWLRDNVPEYEGPAVLVQGDTGPGNFMYAGGRVTAVVDWELSHLGDPMDDLAWLSLRSVQEPFTDLPDRLAEYQELSGHRIDPRRVQYHRVKAEAKLQVMWHRPPRPDAGADGGADGDGGGGDIGNGLIYRMLHQRLWIEAMAEILGLELTAAEQPAEHPGATHENERLFDAVLAQLRGVIVPRITDPLALQRTKGVARVLKYLAAQNRYGAFYAGCELDDLAQLLGARPSSVLEGRDALARAVLAGQVTDLEYVRYLWRRLARENELLRPASGALADRHWPPVQ
jgi:aminoglycoside phosphotransferase (APT) family kinase protein